MLRLLLLLSLLALPFTSAVSEQPLPPDEAFRFSAEAIDANTIRAEWKLAPGYYLYRHKVSFESGTEGITLGEATLPKGKEKTDEFFGDIETYYDRLIVEIPVERGSSAGNTLTLIAHSQGCSEPLGLCYPPHEQKVEITLPPLPAANKPAQSTLPSLAPASTGLLGWRKQQEELLEPDKAFAFNVEVRDANTILARWQIAEGYYLYGNKFHFTVTDANGITAGEAQLPAGKKINDEFFGEMDVYYHNAEIVVPLNRTQSGPVSITFQAGFQGCSETLGVCYPPMSKTVKLDLPAVTGITGNSLAQPVAAKPVSSPPPLSEQDNLANSIATGSTILIIVTFFGLGLLLAFTPCVFPMIPILSGIIIGQGDSITTRRAFMISLVYVLAMALTYTVAGVIAGLFGENLQATFQNPWILVTFSFVFVLLALSMFGFYELQMPSFLQSKLTEVSNRQRGGTLTGVAVMGFLSALIVGPCVAAPLMGALIYIGQTGDAVLGGLALFALSLGMGAPLLALGTSAGKLLPKAGPWMDTIKAVFGVLLLAVAIWMLERILPPAIAMLLWALLFIISAIYMGALEKSPPGWSRLWKGTGIVLLIYGALLLTGAAAGGKDVMQPLRGVFVSAGTDHAETTAHATFRKIKSVQDLQRELSAASQQGRPVMLDFYADWCVSCKELEKYTFSDPTVIKALAAANTLLLQADVTANDARDKELLKKFGLIGPPAILFFGSDEQERKNYRVIGFMDAKTFTVHLEGALQ